MIVLPSVNPGCTGSTLSWADATRLMGVPGIIGAVSINAPQHISPPLPSISNTAISSPATQSTPSIVAELTSMLIG